MIRMIGRLMKAVSRNGRRREARGHEGSGSTAKIGEEPHDDVTTRAFALYERRLRAANALDFDDLLIYAVSCYASRKRCASGIPIAVVMCGDRFRTLTEPVFARRLIGEGMKEGRTKENEQGRVELCVVGTIEIDLPVARFRFSIILGFNGVP